MTSSRTYAPYDPLDPSHQAAPGPRLAEARRRCPVSEPRPGEFVIARHADVSAAVTDHEAFSSRNNFVLDGGTETADLPAAPITAMDPPEHTALRARLRRWFAPAQLRKQEPRIREIVDELIDQLPRGQSVDLFTALGRRVPARTVYAFIGLPEADWDRLQGWADVIDHQFPRVSIDMPEMAALAGYLGELVAIRSTQPATPDVLGGLIHAAGGETPLAPVEIVMDLMQLILAGTDTTGALITNLLYELLVDRSRWERLLADRTLILAAIEESLRHDAPLQYVLRTANDDRKICGCPVQAGNRLVLHLQSANWDEEAWGDDADAFSLDRPAGQATLMSFGYGIHTCLGAPLARLEARIVLERLLDRVPELRLCADYRRQPGPGLMVRRPARLDVSL